MRPRSSIRAQEEPANWELNLEDTPELNRGTRFCFAVFERGCRETPVTGKIIAVGLVDEITDRQYVIVDGADGRVHYAELWRVGAKAANDRRSPATGARPSRRLAVAPTCRTSRAHACPGSMSAPSVPLPANSPSLGRRTPSSWRRGTPPLSRCAGGGDRSYRTAPCDVDARPRARPAGTWVSQHLRVSDGPANP